MMQSLKKLKYDAEEHHETISLIKCLTIKNIIWLKKRFEREPGRHMSRKVFRRCLTDVAHMYFSDEEYDMLCNKLNFSRSVNKIINHLLSFTANENIIYVRNRPLPEKY